MSSHRALEIVLGIVTLVSVVSVPVPHRNTPAPNREIVRPRLDVQKLEELHRSSEQQRDEVARLARDTRILSEALREHLNTPHGDGGTVRVPDARVLESESQEDECSQ